MSRSGTCCDQSFRTNFQYWELEFLAVFWVASLRLCLPERDKNDSLEWRTSSKGAFSVSSFPWYFEWRAFLALEELWKAKADHTTGSYYCRLGFYARSMWSQSIAFFFIATVEEIRYRICWFWEYIEPFQAPLQLLYAFRDNYAHIFSPQHQAPSFHHSISPPSLSRYPIFLGHLLHVARRNHSIF